MLKFLSVCKVFLAVILAATPALAQTVGSSATPPLPTVGAEKTPLTEQPVAVTKFPSVSISRDWMDRGVWVFSGLLVVVGFLQVWLVWRTLGAIKRQAAIMEAQAEQIDMQTDILFKSVSIAETAQQNAINKERPRLSIEIKNFVLGEIPVINYELTCHGTTPAYVQSSWEMTSLARIPDFVWLKTAYGFPLKDLPEVVPSGTIKGFVFIMGSDNCGYPSGNSQMEALEKGELYLHFRVRITFKDIFDEDREHEYLFSKIYGLNKGKTYSDSVNEMLGMPLYPGWGDSAFKYGQDE